MGVAINRLLVVLFVAGAVIEGIRNGATLTLLQHSLFAVGITLELVPRSEDSARWPITRILSTTCIIGGGILLWYLAFAEV